jgi:cytochrome d ubiquinol oxidase subunit II
VALVIGYALLGATWLVMKTEGRLGEKAVRYARVTAIGTLAFIGIISLATLSLDPRFMETWLGWPTLAYTALVPFAVAVTALYLWRALGKAMDHRPFLAAIGLFLFCFVGLGISLFPYIVPLEVTIWDAAAPDDSLGFLLVGTVVLLPLILGYTAYAYYIFRGKVKTGEGYH